jgi:aminoglycoside phosphotransferase (APT) family kinase protein
MTELAPDDAARLLERLRAEVGAPVEYAAWPKRMSGGAFSTNYSFALSPSPSDWSGHLVLRVLNGTSAAAQREAALQAGAHACGLPAPQVRRFEPSADVLGAPFIVMDLLPGRPFLGGIEWYRFARDFPKLMLRWPTVFGEAIRLLASTDATPAIAAATSYGEATRDLVTTRLLTRVAEVLGDSEGWSEGVTWLTANAPALPEQLRLVHGDLWPANVFERDGRIVGLVDWTTAGLGDPALDVGFAKVGLALMPEPFPPPPPISSAVRAAGRRLARQIHSVAAPLVGGDDDRIAYYEALRCVAQIAEVEADRRDGRANGWTRGVPALTRHFNDISGLNAGPA